DIAAGKESRSMRSSRPSVLTRPRPIAVLAVMSSLHRTIFGAGTAWDNRRATGLVIGGPACRAGAIGVGGGGCKLRGVPVRQWKGAAMAADVVVSRELKFLQDELLGAQREHSAASGAYAHEQQPAIQ